MKKLLSLLLLLLMLVGCTAGENGGNAPSVDVYYLTPEGDLSGGSAISKLSFTAAHSGDLLHEALVRLAEDPGERSRMRSAFPPELHINTYSLEDRSISVDLTSAYLALRPVQRTLVRCCLVLTLCSLDEVDVVNITVEGQPTESGLTPDILLLESTSESEYQTELELWFPAKDGACLLSERRQLTIAQNKPLAEYAVEELLRGPQRSDASAAAPAGTELRGISVSNGCCTVDLSQEYYQNRPKDPGIERLMLYALVNTLTELPGIDSVRLSTEGRLLDAYTYIRLDQPLTRAEEFTYPYLVKWDWYAVNLYLVTADGRLATVPVPVDNQEYYDALTMTGRAVELLLTLDRSWGYGLPVPQNTMLLGVEAEDRICTLNLSREFLSGDPRKRDLAAEALAATAIDAGNYLAVRIQLEGSDYADRRLFRKEGDWFVDGN
jgi:germination protein M